MAAKSNDPARPRSRGGPIALALALAAIGLAVAWICWPPPQMGADVEVFRTVDALFTAITAKDEKLLGDCDARLRELREAGKLPSNAAARLDAIIATARAGRWQPAAETLYAFMRTQRREGR